MGFWVKNIYSLCLSLGNPAKKKQQNTQLKKLLHNERKEHKKIK